MYQRIMLPLAIVSALTGCVSSPPKGPLVEYHEGLTPITRPSPCEASYALRPTAEPAAQPLLVLHVTEGARVGFRRELDGSVTAIGSTNKSTVTLPLQPACAYVWEVVPGSVPSWKKRAKQEFRDTTKSVVTQTAAFTAIATLFGLSMLAGDDDPKPGPDEPNGVILPRHHPHP
jgi:hypothetical protein